jgi:hypothetical protein
MLERLVSSDDKIAQRTTGIEMACETIKELSAMEGIRGFEIRAEDDDDAALEIIDKSGLRCD